MEKDRFDKLDFKERRDLFEQFKSRGGRVVDGTGRLSTKKGSIKRDLSQKNSADSASRVSTVDQSADIHTLDDLNIDHYLKSYRIRAIKKMVIAFKSYISQITYFGGGKFKNQFRLLTIQTQEHFNTVQNIAHSLLYSNSFQNIDIAESFYNKFPMYYEILVRLDRLKVKEVYISFRDTSWTTVNSIKPVFLDLIRATYAFIGKSALVLESFKKSSQTLLNCKEIDTKTMTMQLEAAKRSLLFISDFYLKLNTVYPLLLGLNLSLSDLGTRKILGIQAEDVLGSLKQEMKESFAKLKVLKRESIDKRSKAIDEENETHRSEAEETGLSLIRSITFDSKKSADPEMAFYPSRDKIFIVWTTLNFFIERYSIVLSSNQIKILQTMEKGKRVSLQDVFKDFYIEISKIERLIKDYGHLIRSENVDNKFQNSSLVSKSQEQKSNLNLAIRYQVRVLFDKMGNVLEIIHNSLSDYVVDSHKEVASSGREAEGANFFQGKKNIDIVEEFYGFVKAFIYTLTDGDLAGPNPVVELNNSTFFVSAEKTED